MPAWLRRSLLPLCVAALCAFAYSPLVAAGFVGDDFRVLVRAAAAEHAGGGFAAAASELAAIDGEHGSPLAGLSLEASRGTWPLPAADLPAARHAWPFRLENLLLLALGAWGVRNFVRRLLLPWTGSDQAGAAGAAALALILVHPLSVHAVAALSARGVLLVTGLAAWAAAAFLLGRQDRKLQFTALGGGLAFLAGFGGDGALLLPLLLTLAEFTSAHRYRPRRERARTAGTTLLVFGLATFLGAAGRATLLGDTPIAGLTGRLAAFSTWPGARESMALGVEKLGVLVLPANAHGPGLAGVALAGVLFLLAVQPSLLAARSAPRLWGWLLFTWFVSVTLTLLPVARLRIEPTDFSRASELFAGAVVMCVGLGLSSTALSGSRRVLLPGAIAVGYALLAHGNARPFAEASLAARDLRRDVEASRVLHGRDTRTLVVDAPQHVRGIDALGEPIGWLLHSTFAGVAPTSAAVAPARVDSVTLDALLALMREREFTKLRSRPLVLVAPAAALEPRPPSTRLPSGERVSLRVPSPRPGSGPRSWRGDSRSPDLDLEAMTTQALRVTAPAATDTAEPRTVSWRAREPALREGEHLGVWLSGGAAPVVVFDVGASLAWRLGDRIQRVWFEGGMPTVTLAEVLDRLPSPGAPGQRLVPAPDGDDWLFDAPTASVVSEAGARGEFRVGLLDLATWEYVELPVQREPDGRLRVRGAAAHVEHAVSRAQQGGGAGAVAWYLDLRVDGVNVARARGRRIGRSGTKEASPGEL